MYNYKIWRDTKTVNAISVGGLSGNLKLAKITFKFLLNLDFDQKQEAGLDEEEAEIKEKLGFKLKKSITRKSKETIKKNIEKLARKEKRKSKVLSTTDSLPIDLLYNPQKYAEDVFKKIKEVKGADFEYKLLGMRIIGRLIGRHKLQIPSFYTFVMNYIKAANHDISDIMVSVAESVHDQV